MPFAIELYMDSRADAAVRQIWQSLAEAAIPSQPLSAGARPHVSLCLYESLGSRVFPRELEAFARQSNPFSFVLESVETFPVSSGVVFLAPRSSEELLEVHGRFHKDFDGSSATVSSYYLPEHWKPHCTVAENLSSKQVRQAIEVCRKAPLPIRGQFIQIGLVEFLPIKEICVFKLGGR